MIVKTDKFQAFLWLYGMNQANPEPLKVESQKWAYLKFQGRRSPGVLITNGIYEIQDVIAILFFPCNDLVLSPAQGSFSRADATLPTPFAGIDLLITI
jgi:hypothetical protein